MIDSTYKGAIDMSGFYTEADYENSIIELFQGMGYRHVYGPDIERNFNSPLYAGGRDQRRLVQIEKFREC